MAPSGSRNRGIEIEVIDLCSLAPFDAATIRASVARTGRVGVIDIGWEAFGVAAEVARCLLAEDPVLEHVRYSVGRPPATHPPAASPRLATTPARTESPPTSPLRHAASFKEIAPESWLSDRREARAGGRRPRVPPLYLVDRLVGGAGQTSM